MLRKLERRFGKYAVVGLMRYVIILYVLGFVISMMSPNFYYEYLMLDVDKLLRGQVWRIVTFLIQPMDTNPFYLLLSLYLYYMIGNSLEMRWGSFRFNLFYFSGVLFNVLATVVIYIATYIYAGVGVSFPIDLTYINLSMFLAFAVEFAEVQLLLFFVIPIKVKYLGIASAILEGYFIVSAFINGDPLAKWIAVAAFVAVLNFVIFYFATRKYRSAMNAQQIRRRVVYQQSVRRGQQEGPVSRAGATKVITRHKCAVCGRTELDGDDLEFRFCSKCEGNYEYCMDHLYTHTHVVREKVSEPHQ